jgi:PKD repeat protein
VQDEHGGVGEVQVRLTIKDRGPQAKMVISGVRSEGEWLKFDATDSTSPTDPLVKYEWDWNYNGKLFHVAPTAGSLVENRWMKDGHYEVALRVTDADGSTSLSSQMLNIVDQAPVARIVGPDELIAGETATFSAQDSRSSVDAITGYFWDVDYHTEFKPLYKESRAVITYAWKEAGVYRLALEVQDADGSRTQTTHEVRVKLPKILEKTTSKKSGGK